MTVVSATDPESIFGEAARAAALAALASSGVLGSLLGGSASASELARTHELHEGALVRCLNVVVEAGLLSRQGDEYAVNGAVEGALRDNAAPLEFILQLLLALPHHLRTGDSLFDTLDERALQYTAATPRLGRMWRELALDLAQRLDGLECTSILDVGAGSGVWSLALAQRRAGSRVVGLDLEPVLSVFRGAAQEAGVPHGVVAGDYFAVEPGERFGIVVLANVLHLESPAKARTLVERAAGWVEPGGSLVVVDVLFPTPENALNVAVYALHLGMRVAGGEVHEADAVAEWACGAGLVERERLILDERHGGGAMIFESES